MKSKYFSPKKYLIRLNGLVIFRNLLEDPAVKKFTVLLKDSESGKKEDISESYGAFAEELFMHTESWTEYLEEKILESENLYVKSLCGDGKKFDSLKEILNSELELLTDVSEIKGIYFKTSDELSFLPEWKTEDRDFKKIYNGKLSRLNTEGYGIYSSFHVFTVKSGKICPVRHPDPQTLKELPGYERERKQLIQNTEALLKGLPANNVLLYGDAGTGKSSSVKAVANEYREKGLRLIEVKKDQLYEIPGIMEKLSTNPLKFIIFIDDLSFSSNDDNFASLKAILEGNVNGRSGNTVVYATSNRRHLIKETMSDRSGDDIHEMDTMQENMSLSQRFGLIITFQRPDKDRFTEIIKSLSEMYGINIPLEKLMIRAEAFAIRAGGRSPRAAKQFIELVLSEEKLHSL